MKSVGSSILESVIVVASSTAPQKYSQYVHSWIRAWTLYGKANLIDIQPKVLIPRGSALESEHNGAAFVGFAPDATSPISHQAQVNRLLASRWLDCPDSTIVFTADIDMFPGTDDFFVRLVRSTPTDSFVVARNVLAHLEQFPICYISASARTWRTAFNNVESAADIWQTWASPENSNLNWFIDQRLAYVQLNRFSLVAKQELTLWNDAGSKLSHRSSKSWTQGAYSRRSGQLFGLSRSSTADSLERHRFRYSMALQKNNSSTTKFTPLMFVELFYALPQRFGLPDSPCLQG